MGNSAGAEQYKSITRSYYRKCHGAIVMFDITERKSFEDLKLWLQEIKNEIRSKMPKIIIANKFDLVESGQR
jgi:small GTP-binding protein